MSLKFCRVCATEGTNLTEMGSGVNSCGKKLAACIPEIDLYVVEEPLICKSCSYMVDVAYNLREMCLKNEKRFSVVSNARRKSGDNIIIQKSLEPEYLNDCIEDVNRQLIDLDNDLIVMGNETPQNPIEVKCGGLEKPNITEDKKESFCCRKCKTTFCRKASLKSHLKSFHRLKRVDSDIEFNSGEKEFAKRKRCKPNPKIDLMADNELSASEKPKIRATRKKVIFKCQNCGESFEGEKIFDKHSVSCKNNEVKKPNATQTVATNQVISTEDLHSSNALKDFLSCSKSFKIKNEHSSNPEPCTTTCCGIEFQMGSLLQLHTYKTHGKSCGICNENFSSFNALFYHLLTHSVETPVLQCEDCEVMFETWEQLRGHRCVRYKCDLCGATCRSKLRFDSHVKNHEKQAMFKCDKCEMTFTTKFSFSRHYQSIHKQVPDVVLVTKTTNSIKCEDCQRSFLSIDKIRNHKCINYTCKECGATLMSRYRFDRHVLVHRRAKTEVCRICNKLFTARSTFVRHMLTHRENQCQVCNESCESTEGLTNHYLKHCNQMNVTLIDYRKHGVCDESNSEKDKQSNNLSNSINKVKAKKINKFCYVCNEDFISANLFFKHVRSTHSYCKVCQRELNIGKTMMRHIYRHYQQFYNSMNELTVDPEVLINLRGNNNASKRSSTVKKRKQAKKLNERIKYSSKGKKKFDEHLINHDQSAIDIIYCRSEEYEFSEDAYIDHLTIVHRRCFICKQAFQTAADLKKHKLTHVLTGNFVIECPPNKTCEYSECLPISSTHDDNERTNNA